MQNYEKDWQDYRHRRNVFLLVFLGSVPVVSLVEVLGEKLFHTFRPAFVAASLWMAWFVYCGVRASRWRCPRCGNWFYGSWWYSLWPLAWHCVHCGLPKYAKEGQGVKGPGEPHLS